MAMKQKNTNIVICLLSCVIVVMLASMSQAGSNASAGCALDMDYTTRDYDPEDPSKDIDPALTAEADQEITIAVVAQNVSNLDTYRVEVNFDPNRMKFLEGYEEDVFNDITNLLKTNGGRTIWIAPREKQDAPGKIVMANSLIGSDEDQAPEGSGIIALLKFQVLDADPDNQLTLSDVNYIDTPGSITDPMLVDSVTNLTNATVNSCDINGDGQTDLKDIILALQVLAGMNSDDDNNIHLADINDDDRIGIAEVIYILKKISEIQED